MRKLAPTLGRRAVVRCSLVVAVASLSLVPVAHAGDTPPAAFMRPAALPAAAPMRDQAHAAVLLSTLARYARHAPNRTPFELRFEASMEATPGARAAALRTIERFEASPIERRKIQLGSHADASAQVFSEADAIKIVTGAGAAVAASARPLGAAPPKELVVRYVGVGCATIQGAAATTAAGVIYSFAETPLFLGVNVQRDLFPAPGKAIPNLVAGSFSADGAQVIHQGASDDEVLFMDSSFPGDIPPTTKGAPGGYIPDDVSSLAVAAAVATYLGKPHTHAQMYDALEANLHTWIAYVLQLPIQLQGLLEVKRLRAADLLAAAAAPEQKAGPLGFKLSTHHPTVLADCTLYYDVSPPKPPTAAKPH